MPTHKLTRLLLPSSTYTKDMGNSIDRAKENALKICNSPDLTRAVVRMVEEVETIVMENAQSHYNTLLEHTDELLKNSFTEDELEALWSIAKKHKNILTEYVQFNLTWSKIFTEQLSDIVMEATKKVREDNN